MAASLYRFCWTKKNHWQQLLNSYLLDLSKMFRKSHTKKAESLFLLTNICKHQISTSNMEPLLSFLHNLWLLVCYIPVLSVTIMPSSLASQTFFVGGTCRKGKRTSGNSCQHSTMTLPRFWQNHIRIVMWCAVGYHPS